MSEIKKSAKHGNFIIQQAENDSVSIICDNTRQALRDIANEIGMEFDPEWNTRYFGHRLINFINGVDTTRKARAETTEEVKKEFDEDNLISDTDWNWWVSLSDSVKYVLIKNLEFRFCDEVCEELPSWDEDDCLQSEVDLNDRSIMGNFVANYITGYYGEEGEFNDDETLTGIEIPDYVFGLNDLYKLSHLKNLEEVSFYYNNLDIIPEGVGKLTHLKELGLNRNEITATSLDVLSTLTNLEVLNLSSNLLSGKAEDYEPLTKLMSLRKLDISWNSYLNSAVGILDKIAKLTNLEELNLCANKLNEHDFSPLHNLVNLRKLDVSYCDLENAAILDEISKITNLEDLDLSNNKFNGKDFSPLSHFTNLRKLNLSKNDLEADSVGLDKLTNLEELNLSKNKFKGYDFSSFKNLTNLRKLNLEENEITITDDLLRVLFSLPNLEQLELCGNELSVDKFPLIEELVKNRDNYIFLSITNWNDEIRESEEYKKLKMLFEEKEMSLG